MERNKQTKSIAAVVRKKEGRDSLQQNREAMLVKSISRRR